MSSETETSNQSDDGYDDNNVITIPNSLLGTVVQEDKPPRKCIRVLIVSSYLFFVSLVAIMLSLYYIFIWDPQINLNGTLVKGKIHSGGGGGVGHHGHGH